MQKTVVRIIAFALAAILLLGLIAVAANADAVGGKAGYAVSWSYDAATGTLTISGEGVMYDYDGVDYRPWAPYIHDIRHIVIEEGVTALGRNVFFDCSVETVEFPSTLLRVPAGTFKHCPDLTAIDLSGTALRIIEKQAFANCPALKSVSLPDAVTGGFWYDAFNGDSAIETVTTGNAELAGRVKTQAAKAAERPVYPVQFPANREESYTDENGNVYTYVYSAEGELVMATAWEAATGKLTRIYFENGLSVRVEVYNADGTLNSKLYS